MKHLASLPLIFLSAPALAHDGAHLHPHGAGNWIALALGLVGFGVALWVQARK